MIQVATVVAEALEAGRAVVALESTVLTHGLPRPRNLELGRALERVVREHGAIPATIGVLDGALVVGIDAAQMERLAAGPAAKASPWNLAALVAAGRDAGTTVATTLHAAAAAGIRAFATGGIGGVHPEPFDESADLAALARYPVVTVCAGAKSVLNVPATIERLETAGVPVLGWRSDRLAGFHVPLTDLPLAARVESAAEVARAFEAHRRLGLPGGVLVSHPVDDGLDPTDLARWLEQARADVKALGVRGKDLTPALLAALAERSRGATVDVNVRLLEANARLAADVAVALTAPHAEGTP
ncbi:MAG: pseudouridine-5'-phosphate glycosidase [Trueperaceae bacterium]|nr:pseudouridine-5'-phosphate glycosidase [Trueperaceae bacterium]